MRTLFRGFLFSMSVMICFAGTTGFAQSLGERFVYQSTGEIIAYEESKALKGGVDFSAPDDVHSANGITFRIIYQDGPGTGFNDNSLGAARQARWKDALSYVASVLNETGTVNILVTTSQNVNSSLLATCGTTYFIDTIGCTTPQILGGSLFDVLHDDLALPDDTVHAQLTVNWFHNYNLTANPPAVDEIDLLSVLVHEFTHAVGIASVFNSNGSSQFLCDTYTTWDALLVRDTGNFPLLSGPPVSFQANVSDMIGNDLALNGADATTQFGSRPPIFSPGTFLPGSSISHWDSGLILGGAVMEPSFSPGEMLREYRTFEEGALRDLGWSNVVVSGGGLDMTPPVITRLGAATVTHECGDSFTDPGATAQDNVDGNITGNIVVGGDTINANTVPGTYQITYNVMDAAGNAATQVTRTVIVEDTLEPIIVQVSAGGITVDCQATLTDPGANATDDCDGAVAVTANTTGVDLTTAGTYQIVYTATDGAGNTAMSTRTVTVTGPTCPTPEPTGCACADPNKELETQDASVFLGDGLALALMAGVLGLARRRRS